MFEACLIAAALVWIALLGPLVLQQAKRRVPVLDGPVLQPFLLLMVFSFMPLVFNIERDDAMEVFDKGLSASNRVEVALTGMAGLYLVYRIVVDRRLLAVACTRPYVPFSLMLLVNAASAIWSIAPLYTVFRSVEVGIFTLLSIVVFDRSEIERRLPDLLAGTVVLWLMAVLPELVSNLSHGIVFSAAKNNMMPLVCAALLVFAVFHTSCPRRKTYTALGLAGFTIAGSAASTAALVASVGPAFLIASRSRGRQLAGTILFLMALGAFAVLMLGLARFPLLLEALSIILQKPAIELANATGRGEFWPVFLAATRSRVFGSGFSAADHFIQLLIPTGDLAADLGRQNIHISSAHNMVLSAWAGTGILGVVIAFVVLGTAIQAGLKLPNSADRRFVVTVVLMLILNGMTTPGIFQDWNVNLFGFVGLLAFARVGAMRGVRAAPTTLRRALSAGPFMRRVSEPG